MSEPFNTDKANIPQKASSDRPKEIPEALDRLEARVDLILETSEVLTKRLEPVLRSDGSKEGTPSPLEAASFVPMVQRLKSMIERLDKAIENFDSIYSRLEL